MKSIASQGRLSSHERFAQLLMILEAQFGDTMTPIEQPRLAAKLQVQNGIHKKEDKESNNANEEEEDEEDDEERTLSEKELAQAEASELARLHSLGIPFPGVEIKIDKYVARVWLEDLEVDCSYVVLRDRVRVVLERAVETVASMWTEEFSERSKLITANGHGNGESKLLAKKLAMIEA